MTNKQIDAILASIKLPEEVLYKELGKTFIKFQLSGKWFKIEIKEVKK